MRILPTVLTIALLVTLSGALSACVIEPDWGHSCDGSKPSMARPDAPG